MTRRLKSADKTRSIGAVRGHKFLHASAAKPSQQRIVRTSTEARNLGAKMARESVKKTKLKLSA